MAREKWEEIVAYYKTYISILQPLLREIKRTIIEIPADELVKPETIPAIIEEETKRKVHRVKAISEFNAYFRAEVYQIILRYFVESEEEISPDDLKDYLMDFFDESIEAFELLLGLVEDDPKKHRSSLLFQLTEILSEILLPQGKKIGDIYDQLIEQSPEWYEAQRYILKPTTFYREEIGEMTLPGLSPKIYQIINNITSLFNLEPNFMDMPEDTSNVIPAIMKADVFEPFIDKIANAEEEAVKRLVERMDLRLIYDIFIGPTPEFLALAEPHKYIISQKDDDGKIRWIPQFSNETLVLLYLAKVSSRRGFLSKELINWISMNYAFIIYNAILHTILADDNIFYNLFLDLKTEEKILPYLMKLLCFENYLRLDRSKIRDSPTYRKEIFTFLGSKIEAIDQLTYFLVDKLEKLIQ